MPGLTDYFASPSSGLRGVVAARLADGRYRVRALARVVTAANATGRAIPVGARVILDRSSGVPCIVAVVSLGGDPGVKEVTVNG